MDDRPKIESALGGYRILDLTDEKGLFCGKILGDLGADVIKIEKPGGDPARNIGPFYADTPDSQKSLFWFAYNMNKRGLTLDIETSDGKELFKRLVKTADCVVESFHPGYLDSLKLGYEMLRRVNQRIILTSISPFGQTGPYKNYKGADIVLWGIGGMMYLCGDTDRPPVQVSFPQAYLTGAAEAAAATMIAMYYQETTGKGQHVDVSIHASIPWLTMEGVEFWPMMQVNVKRKGVFRESQSGAQELQIWRCKDGYVHFSIYGGVVAASFMPGLVKWLDEDGVATETLRDISWGDFDLHRVSQEACDVVVQPMETFLKKHTKAEIYEGTKKYRALVYPVNTVADTFEDPQLKARGFWGKLEHTELGATLTYPGAFAKLSETPIKMWRHAPRIGEHNEEVYFKELGLSREELLQLEQRGVI
ncbi:MAG: CoA transferase [Dehalococcoidia bacterium]|nr:CoA transferase [Dehalococcoidia bacterium]